MRILAIETSCDETAISLIETRGDFPSLEMTVLGDVVLSQAKLHAEFGGVYPNLAKREHAKNLIPILQHILKQADGHIQTHEPAEITSDLAAQFTKLFEHEEGLAEHVQEALPNISVPDIDLIAVTTGPGLAPALWVGVNFAKALALAWKKPLLPINHMEGHAVSSLITVPDVHTPAALRTINFPALVLLVSGGHTELILMEKLHSYRTIGKTRDDAVGECFDKVARMLGLPYPGGPEVSKLAAKGSADATLALPRPMLHSHDFDFSFAGLKTAVMYLLKARGELSETEKQNLAYEFETAAADVLTKKTIDAAKEMGAKTVILGGGVSANKRLRETLATAMKQELSDVEFLVPPLAVSTDNALMIAVAAALRADQPFPPLNDIRADGNWSLFRGTR